jgi:radical SAM enzyme (rSAM/lipoprotein system)
MRLGLKRRLTLELLSSYKRQQAILHPLTYLLWECTLRCDLECAHCGSDCRASSPVPDMPLSDLLPVLEGIKGRYDPAEITVGITGGEPLLRPDLSDCGAAINALGFPWGMVTNGYSMTVSRFDSLLKAGLGSLSLSLDGLKSSHEALRGRKGSFDRTLAAVTMATAAIRSGRKLNLDVVTCANQANLSELAALRELLLGAGVERWRIFTIFPRGRAARLAEAARLVGTARRDWLFLEPKGYRSLLDMIVAFRKEGGIEVDYACEGYLGPYEGEARSYCYFCRSGINFASILVDGSIAGCASARRDFIQGSIYRDSFLRVWDEGFEAMRDRSWTRRGPCAKCSSYRYCLGNGLHLWNEGGDGPMRCNLREIVQGLR